MSKKSFGIREGTEYKGGVNSRPSTPRPKTPPSAQSPSKSGSVSASPKK